MRDNTNYWANPVAILKYIQDNLDMPADGKSTYELAVEAGYTGTLTEWLATQVGPAGPASNSSRRIQTLSSASGAIICNWALYDEIRLRLTGPVTLSFQNAKDGQGCMLKITQDATGGRTVTLPSPVRYNALIQHYNPTLRAGAVDKVGFMYDSADGTYDFVSFIPDIAIP